MHAMSKRFSPLWPGLAALLLASGCPANPADVTLREADGGEQGRIDASSTADARTPPDAFDPGAPDAAADAPDAQPGAPDGGMIDAAPPALAYYGQYDELPSSEDYPQDKLILQSATVLTGGTLDRIGIIVEGASGTSAQLALYRDSAGSPDTLVASTGIFTTQPGRNERAPQERVTVEAGTYWIGMFFADSTGVKQSTVTTTVHSGDFPFSGGLPSQLLGTTDAELPIFNIYIGIQE